MKKTLLWVTILHLSVLVFGQDLQVGKRNNQMVSKERNYKSFDAPTAKSVSDEMAQATQASFRSHPEYGILPHNVQCEDCYEVIQDRTALTRHFVKNGTDGKVFYNQAGASPINYQDAAGNWRAIDPRMFPSVTPNVFIAANQLSPTKIDLNSKEVSVQNGNASFAFNRNLKLYHRTDNGKELVASADWSKATVGTDGVYAKNIFPGIDLEVYVVNGGLKTNFIIADKLAYSNGDLLIEDDVKLPAGTSFATAFARKKGNGYQGPLTVNLDADGSRLYEMGEAIGVDASAHRTNKPQKLNYEFSGTKLNIVVPIDWLNTPGLGYPVAIDPLVTSSATVLQASILGSGGDGSGTWNSAFACTYTCNVSSPANSTITDIKWSFDYIAQNGGVKGDGAVDFLYLGFRSPSNASLYWSCSAAPGGFFPGVCTGSNISIWSDLGSHMLPPACTPYNMQFIMRFYDAQGFTCDNTYIGANSNWVMTVEGHTVEFQNAATPFTISSNTVCAGQNLTATFNGAVNGVSPYSVNWSLNASGTPSAGTGSNPSINFPTAGTATVYCILTDNCGIQQTATKTVTVNPAPNISIVPTLNPLCVGQSTTLNASGATTYTWSANAGGGGGSSATVTPPLGSTVYSVTGTGSGCPGSASTTITVNALPTVSITANPTSLCASQTATLTASGASTYTWSANEGGTSNNPTTVTPGSTDTYTVTGTDGNNCVNTAQVTVTVTPVPTITATASQNTICAGVTATLTASGGATYSWSSGGTAATETVAPANTTTYTVTETSSACPATATVAVNVNSLPVITATANPTTICSGQTSTITASGATTFTWSTNSGGGNNNPINVSPTSNDTYTVAGTDGNGCTDSTTVSVSVDTPPTLAVSASDTTLCSGQTTTLTATGATNYTWSPGGGGASITQTPAGSTTYTLIGANGACLDSITFAVTVNATPTVSTVASSTAICSGDSSLLTASGANTYTWSANAGGVQTNTVYVTPGSTGNNTYSVTGTDNNGCTGTSQITVSVTATPVIIALANPPVVCSGSTVGLVANSPTATSYTWSTGATGQITTATPTVNPTTYTVTGSNGTCSSYTTVTVAVTQQPTVTATATTLSPICSGTADTLVATVSPPGATVVWSPGGANTPTVSVTPGTTTPYTVVATLGTCSASATTTVTVKPTPTVAVTSAGAATICSGDSIYSILFNATAGSTVSWTNNGTGIGLASSGQDSIHGYMSPVVTTTQTGTITATATLNGCQSNPQTYVITINPRPVITGNYSIDSSKCGAPGAILGLTASGGTGSLTYQWTMGGVAVGNSANLTNVFGGSYLLTVTDANNCPAWAGPYTVGASSPVVVAASGTPTSGSATLSVSFTGNTTGATSWNWDFGNGTGSGAQNPVGVYTTGGDYIATLVATNAQGCSGMDTVHIHVDQAISLVVPNIFSPNGDNINDEFGFIAMGITDLTCDIFNRWGQKVKTLSGPTAKWDGKLDNGNNATEGTYFYTVVASSYDGKPHNKQGTITLVK